MGSSGAEVRGFQTELLGVYHTETGSASGKHAGGRGLTKQLPARFTNEHIFQPPPCTVETQENTHIKKLKKFVPLSHVSASPSFWFRLSLFLRGIRKIIII